LLSDLFKYDTEVAAVIFQRGRRYYVSLSVSDGVICSRSAQCGANTQHLRSPVRGGRQVGYIHTHPSNNRFSNHDLGVAYFVSVLDKRPQTAYVVLANSKIWAWSTDVIKQHPQAGARDWQPYMRYSRRVR
jgi:hypothetical protein